MESLLWLAKHPRWPLQQNNNTQRVDCWGWLVLVSWECLSRVLGKSLSAVDMWLIVSICVRWNLYIENVRPRLSLVYSFVSSAFHVMFANWYWDLNNCHVLEPLSVTVWLSTTTGELQWLAKHPWWPMSRPHSQPIPFKHFHLEHTFWPAHQNHHLRNLTGYHANKLTGITRGIRILGYLFSQWQSCLTMLLWICCASQNVYSQWQHLKGIGCEWDLLHLNELKLSSNCR